MFTSFQRLSVIRQGEKGGGLRVAPLLACRVGIPPALPHGAATFPRESHYKDFLCLYHKLIDNKALANALLLSKVYNLNTLT